MIASGLHSGLAIKRQRKRRMDHRRARERRFSTRSNESGLSSCGSLDGVGRQHRKKQTTAGPGFEANVGIGMLHIGVVFVVLGGFLLGSGIMPDDLEKFEWSDMLKGSTWWNELVISGAFSLALGVFLIILNKFISRREEEDLEDYVQRQLTRTRSGHALVRDVETGNLTTKRSKSQNVMNDELARSRRSSDELPRVHSPCAKSPTSPTTNPHIFMNGDTGLLSPQLEKIMEEDVPDRGHHHHHHVRCDENDSLTASLSAGSPSETQELLFDQPYMKPTVPSKYHQVRMTRI